MVRVDLDDIARGAEEILSFILEFGVKHIGDFSGFELPQEDVFQGPLDVLYDVTSPNLTLRLRTNLQERARDRPKRTYQLGCFRELDGFECITLDMAEIPNKGILSKKIFTTYESSMVVPIMGECLSGYKNFGNPHYLVKDFWSTRDGYLFLAERELRALSALRSKK
jgi:hypothetical protein